MQLPDYTRIISEYTYKKSRIDFCLDNTILIEVKGVTLVRNGIALFPDAPTKRGKKHVETLLSALEEGFSSYVIFIVQRPDAYTFVPNTETDPDFADALEKAIITGVDVIVYTAKMIENYIYLRENILG
ncbi:MAG: DNA/RNA nuclease SfsA [Candidatus Methanofastidiosia archaeon]